MKNILLKSILFSCLFIFSVKQVNASTAISLSTNELDFGTCTYHWSTGSCVSKETTSKAVGFKNIIDVEKDYWSHPTIYTMGYHISNPYKYAVFYVSDETGNYHSDRLFKVNLIPPLHNGQQDSTYIQYNPSKEYTENVCIKNNKEECEAKVTIYIQPYVCKEDEEGKPFDCIVNDGEKVTAKGKIKIAKANVSVINIADFGEMKLGEEKTLDIKVRNIGNERFYAKGYETTNLIVSNPKGSFSIYPGETGNVKVTFKAIKPGKFEHTALVVSEDIPYSNYGGYLYIPIKANVVDNSTQESQYTLSVNKNPNYRNWNGEYDPLWDWTLTKTGNPNDYPWNISVETNCNSHGTNHNGNFIWNGVEIKLSNEIIFGNGVEKTWVKDALVDLPIKITNANGDVIYNSTVKGPVCYTELPNIGGNNNNDSNENDNSNKENSKKDEKKNKDDKDNDEDEQELKNKDNSEVQLISVNKDKDGNDIDILGEKNKKEDKNIAQIEGKEDFKEESNIDKSSGIGILKWISLPIFIAAIITAVLKFTTIKIPFIR